MCNQPESQTTLKKRRVSESNSNKKHAMLIRKGDIPENIRTKKLK